MDTYSLAVLFIVRWQVSSLYVIVDMLENVFIEPMISELFYVSVFPFIHSLFLIPWIARLVN